MAISVEILEGNLRKITATFAVPGVSADLDDFSTWTPTDPTTITFSRKRLGAADSTIETWTFADAQLSRDGTGVYSLLLPFPTAGGWVVGAAGTESCEAYDEVTISVKNAEARAA